MMRSSVFLLVLSLAGVNAIEESSHGNPIRKVVTMLQDMSKKVTTEGEKELALYDKFMCYCKNNVGTLDASMADANAKIDSATLALKSNGEKLAMTEADLKEHTASRDDAKAAIDKATALRDKQAADFAKYKSDADTNIASLSKAVAAIEGGMSGSFLQTQAANIVRNFAMEKADVADAVRQELLSFLSGKQTEGYAPASGEIVGILKQMTDTMVKDLGDATSAEGSANTSYEKLMAAKQGEVDTLQAQLEREMQDVGDLKIRGTEMADDLAETKESLGADTVFLTELKKGCDTKAAEWDEVCKQRTLELKALADTIKTLNDDDALELFKKTLPGASASFVQIQEGTASMRSSALAALREAHLRSSRSMHLGARPGFDLIELALNGKQKGFAKVITMIDTMVTNLKQEQVDDNSKKGYCDKSFDETDDKKKQLEGSISDSKLAIDEITGTIATLTDEMAKLVAGIKQLDAAVAEATATRKDESAEHDALRSGNTAAVEILRFAKNRLNKFYNPKLYKPPAKQELAADDRIVANMASFVQIRTHSQDDQDDKAAPAPPPETFGAYSKKSEEGGGVIAMIDLLVADLEKEIQISTTDNDNAQEEYDKLMADSGAKRTADSESVTLKDASKAEAEEMLQSEKSNKNDLGKDLMGTMKEIYALHGACDWLLKFYDVRKDARTGEVDALGKAKAVLSGADYSLLQTQRALRR